MLPLENVVNEGIHALSRDSGYEESIPALLVSIGAPRLRRLGYNITHTVPNAEHRLYKQLCLLHPDRPVHSLFNSYIRRLVSFERAAESSVTRKGTVGATADYTACVRPPRS